MTPGEGALRLTRTAVFAVSAVALASAAHLAADGDVPRLPALLAVPLVMLVVHLLAAGRRGPMSLFLGMGLTQVGLHLAFMAASLAATCTAPAIASPSPMAGMAMPGPHAHVTVCEAGHSAGLLPSASMIVAHLLATMLVVAVLSRGEVAVWALAAALRFRFAVPRVTLRLPALRRLPVSTRARRHPHPAVHLRSVQRRGPPALRIAAPA